MRTIRRASTVALLEARHALDAKRAEEAVHLALDALREAWGEPSRNVALDALMEKRRREHETLTGRSSKKGTESDE